MVDVFATSSAAAIVTNATSAVGAAGRNSRKRPRPRRQNTAPATSENETGVFSHRRLSVSDSIDPPRYTEYSRVTATATIDDDDGSDVISRMSTSDDRQMTSGLSSEVTTPFTDATSFAGIALSE
ncbi:uncharacterized protein LOC113388483 [Ctenocephalides felis]|uniref:uncharacterized protein LOC113388483 n=1 Tax=Ctenocephalides felis TaxID=7515 RepID=UPI000E6E4302|nr:uncharacterized protein LOC113388483 [Ctenocephalides felis]